MILSLENLAKLNKGPRTSNFSRKPVDSDAAHFETQAHIQDVCVYIYNSVYVCGMYIYIIYIRIYRRETL